MSNPIPREDAQDMGASVPDQALVSDRAQGRGPAGFDPSRVPYAPASARKIDEAAHLIVRAARLLDDHAPIVIALIEAIPGTEHINRGLVDNLSRLALQLEGEAP